MSNLYSVDIAQFLIYAKNGLTPEEVEVRFGCTENDLLKRLTQLYKGNEKKAHGLYSQLEANRKKIRKNHSKASEEVSFVKPEPETTAEAPIEEQAPAPLASSKSDLEELKEKEENDSKEVMQLENKYWGLLGEIRALRSKLQEYSTELEESDKKLQKLKATIKDIVEEANNLGDQANEIALIIRSKKVALEELRHEIEQKKSISLFVYKDGRIEAPENPDFVIDDDGYLNLKSNLSEREECLDLRLRDVTTLARVLKISEKTDNLTLIFEDEGLEIVYMTIKGA